MTLSQQIEKEFNLTEKQQILVDTVINKLTAKGYECRFAGLFNTDFGRSCYYIVEKDGQTFKFRFSDHSVTNVVRMAEEVHICFDYNEDMQRQIPTGFERTFFPENFEKVYLDEQKFKHTIKRVNNILNN